MFQIPGIHPPSDYLLQRKLCFGILHGFWSEDANQTL